MQYSIYLFLYLLVSLHFFQKNGVLPRQNHESWRNGERNATKANPTARCGNCKYKVFVSQITVILVSFISQCPIFALPTMSSVKVMHKANGWIQTENHNIFVEVSFKLSKILVLLLVSYHCNQRLLTEYLDMTCIICGTDAQSVFTIVTCFQKAT